MKIARTVLNESCTIKTSTQLFRSVLKRTWKKVLGIPIQKVIAKFNPILKEWANYYKIGVSSEIFSSMDHYIWIRQYRYVRRTHPNKSWNWIKDKYWGKLCPTRKDKWVFGCKKTRSYMYRLGSTLIKHHVI